MSKMLKVIFPTAKTIFVVLRLVQRQTKCGKGMAKNRYYWNLSCHCSTDWVCNVRQKVWVDDLNMWGLEWLRLPQGLRGPQENVKIGALVRARKQLECTWFMHSSCTQAWVYGYYFSLQWPKTRIKVKNCPHWLQVLQRCSVQRTKFLEDHVWEISGWPTCWNFIQGTFEVD